MASQKVMNEIFGKVYECWDCEKQFRTKTLYRLKKDSKPVPLCNRCMMIRRGLSY